MDRLITALIIIVCTMSLHLNAINVCQTKVFIGDAVHVFHTDSLGAVESAAHTFCSVHMIAPVECDRIKQMNKRDCYNVIERDESTEALSVAEISGHSVPVDISENPEKSSTAGVRVDYSTKVGPSLPVFGLSTNTCPNTIMNELNGIIVNSPKQDAETEAALARACASNTESDIPRYLQAYANEGPRQAVRRFCGMMQLAEYQCKQIRTAFLKLNGIDPGDSDGDGNGRSVGGGTEGSGVVERFGIQFWRLWRARFNYVYHQAAQFGEKYASILLLLAALLFVVLQVHG